MSRGRETREQRRERAANQVERQERRNAKVDAMIEAGELDEDPLGRERPPRIVSYPLLYPIEVAGRWERELEVRRPNYGDMKKIEGLSEDRVTEKLLALLCGLPKDAIEQLDAADVAEVGELISGFFDKPKRLRSGSED